MTKAEFEETMAALRQTRRDATSSKAAALECLREIGLVDEDGELTPEYQDEEAA